MTIEIKSLKEPLRVEDCIAVNPSKLLSITEKFSKKNDESQTLYFLIGIVRARNLVYRSAHTIARQLGKQVEVINKHLTLFEELGFLTKLENRKAQFKISRKFVRYPGQARIPVESP